ncbi:MAG: hypothetical protein NTW19_15420 [Planctomycetota bacterium]|nr:hypothetical protein [Planctomycetota bacterium]
MRHRIDTTDTESGGAADAPLEWWGMNHHSPQAVGLVGWWPALPSRGSNLLRDFAQGAHAEQFGSPSWSATPELGLGMRISPSNYLAGSDVNLPVGDAPRTIVASLRVLALPTADLYFFGYGTIAAHEGFYAGLVNVSGNCFTLTDVGGALYTDGTASVGGVYRVVWSCYGGNAWAAWVNGLPQTLTATGMASALSTSLTGTAYLGGYLGGGTSVVTCELFDVRVYDHGLTETMVEHLELFPWDLHAPRPRRRLFVPPSVSSNLFRRTLFPRAGSRGTSWATC